MRRLSKRERAIVDDVITVYNREDYRFVESELAKGIKFPKLAVVDNVYYLKKLEMGGYISLEGIDNQGIRRIARTVDDKIQEMHPNMKYEEDVE